MCCRASLKYHETNITYNLGVLVLPEDACLHALVRGGPWSVGNAELLL